MACKLVEKNQKDKDSFGLRSCKTTFSSCDFKCFRLYINIVLPSGGVGRKRDPATPTAGEVFQKQQQNHRPGNPC